MTAQILRPFIPFLLIVNVLCQNCLILEIRGAKYHTALNSRWSKSDKEQDGEAVYTQMDNARGRWLWWKDHGAFSRWYMGTDLGSKSVEAYRDGAAGDTVLLPKSPNNWFVVHDNKWVEDTTMILECKEFEQILEAPGGTPGRGRPPRVPQGRGASAPPSDTANKKTVRIMGSKTGLVNSLYTSVGVNEGKSMFKSVTNLYLFWKKYSGYSRWYVGKKQGDDQNVLAFIDSDADNPEALPKHLNWMELKGKEWSPNANFRVSIANNIQGSSKTAEKGGTDGNKNIRDKKYTPERNAQGCSVIVTNSRDRDVDKIFYIQDGEHNGRPFYKSSDSSYLYFVSFRGGHISRWHMSYPNGKLDDRVKAYANSKAATLDQMTKDDTWLVYDTNQNMWQQKPDMRIYCSDCKVTIKDALDNKVNGDYGITPYQNEGRPVWVALPAQNRYLYFNAHKNYGRWMLSLLDGDIGGVVHAYVNSWGETPDLIDKYERWEEKTRGHRFRQSRLNIKGNCGSKNSATPPNSPPQDPKKNPNFNPDLHKNCPENMVVKTEPKQKYAFVTWTDSDPQGGWRASYGASAMTPGSKFNIGTTAVQFTLKDKKGMSHVCDFEVTVNDEEAPNLFCPGDMHRTTRMNSDFQIVTWKDPYPYDNSLLPVDLKQTEGPKSGDQLKVGTHVVKYEATDHADNKKTCQFRIFVRDREAPRIHNCPKDFTIQTYESSNWAAFPSWKVPSADDNVDKNIEIVRVAGVDPGTKVSIGKGKEDNSISVIYQATDSAANRAECKFTINLVKNHMEKTHDSYRGTIPSRDGDVGGERKDDDLNVEQDVTTASKKRKPKFGRSRGSHKSRKKAANQKASDIKKEMREARKGGKRKKKVWRIVLYVLIGLVCVSIVGLIAVVYFSQEKTIKPDDRYDLSGGGARKSSSWCSWCETKRSRVNRMKQGKRV